jgi:DNA mismatch endonuclease (patch repair protein)
MTDWLTRDQRSRNMAAIRSTGTSTERRLHAALKLLFPRRKIIEDADLPGRPDCYLPGMRLAIFADGCFWHGCPTHGRIPEDNRDYWQPKLERNAVRDRGAILELRRMGIRPLRIWDHELRPAAIDGALNRIRKEAQRPMLQGRRRPRHRSPHLGAGDKPGPR